MLPVAVNVPGDCASAIDARNRSGLTECRIDMEIQCAGRAERTSPRVSERCFIHLHNAENKESALVIEALSNIIGDAARKAF